MRRKPKTPVEQAIHHIKTCTSMEELRAYMSALHHELPVVWADEAVEKAKDARKAELSEKKDAA